MDELTASLFVGAGVIILVLFIDRWHLKNYCNQMQEFRNRWSERCQIERQRSSDLVLELSKTRGELETLKAESERLVAEKRSAGIALGLIDPIEEVDEIPF